MNRVYQKFPLLDYDRLRCDFCGGELPLSTDDSTRYLATGWPQCCGETMKLSGRSPDTGTPPQEE